MNKVIRITVVLFLFLCLVLVKIFEDHLFYDPLLIYFKRDYLTKGLPNLNLIKLFFSYSIRFLINALISFAIIKIAFKKHASLKTISLFYALSFIVLNILFFVLLITKLDTGYLLLFYLRRFLIQPLFIIILFPFLYLIKKGYRFNDE